jgi:phenylalanyl-tRNA synthetase beta chain
MFGDNLSFVSDTYAPIAKAIEDANCALIKKVSVVDTYADENGKSITIRLLFSHPERTLTKDEVLEVVNTIAGTLEAQGITIKGGIAL